MSLPLLLRMACFYSVFRTRFSAGFPPYLGTYFFFIYIPFVLFFLDAVCVVYLRLRPPSKCARGPQTVDDTYDRDQTQWTRRPQIPFPEKRTRTVIRDISKNETKGTTPLSSSGRHHPSRCGARIVFQKLKKTHTN